MLNNQPVTSLCTLKVWGLSLLLAVITTQASAMGNPYNPWSGYYAPGFYPGMSPYSGMSPYARPMPAYPRYYAPYRMAATPWNGWNSGYSPWYSINKPMPWGTLTGGISGNGNFWVNIKVSGNFQDLQILAALMQMSSVMSLNSDQGISAMPIVNMD